jgi:type II secretory pathway component GspD/PulD (secretin)
MIRLRFLYILVFSMFAIPAFADDIEWKQHYYSHYAEAEPLESILKGLMHGEGIAVSVTDKANASVSLNIESLPPDEVLKQLEGTYQFIWYFYGRVLYVSDMTEVQTATLKLIHMLPKDFTEQLKDMGIYDKKFSWHYSDNSGIIRFTGSKRLVELVMETAVILDTDTSKPSGQFVYIWHDKKGGKHYSSTPPRDRSVKHGLYNLADGEIVSVSKK